MATACAFCAASENGLPLELALSSGCRVVKAASELFAFH